MPLLQSAPFGQLFYNLYCFTIFIHNQLLTTNPLTDDVSAFAAAAATLLCCAAFLWAQASPCQAGRNLCCSWLSRSVMNYCSDVSVGTAELSHRVPAQSPACSRAKHGHRSEDCLLLLGSNQTLHR